MHGHTGKQSVYCVFVCMYAYSCVCVLYVWSGPVRVWVGIRILYVGPASRVRPSGGGPRANGPAGPGQEWWWWKWKSIWVSCKHSSKPLSVISLGPDALNSKLRASPACMCLDGPPVNEPTRITPTTRRSPVTSPSGRPPTRCRSALPSISTHFLNSTPSIFDRFSLITTGLAPAVCSGRGE